jgi:hypothetical protein
MTYNFIDGDFFESLSDFSYGDIYSSNLLQPDEHNLKLIFDKYEHPKIFIETGRVFEIFKNLSYFTDRKCDVICHNSDVTFDERIYKFIPSNVEKFWCQNFNGVETDVIKSLPIGLERKRWFPEQKKQESLFDMMSREDNRNDLVYMNFNISTSPIRKFIYEQLKDKTFIRTEMIGNGGDYQDYLLNLKKSHFVISPPGNGIDCHRNWEALYLGCTPIVLKTPFSEQIFGDMNVLLVENYAHLTEQLMIDFINKNENKGYNSKLDRDHWSKIINHNV